MTILCTPINSFLSRIKIINTNNKVTAIISISIINFLLIITFYYVGNFIYDSTSKYLVNDYISINDSLEKIIKYFNFNEKTFNNFSDNYYKIINRDMFKKGAEYTLEGIVSYFIANIAVYFILVDKYGIFNFVKYFIPKKYLDNFIEKMKILKQMLAIEIILALFTTLETIIGFMILRISNAFMLGVICGILDILPYVGTIIMFIPMFAYNVIIKNYFKAAGIIVLYIFLQINRQILETKFISNKLSIHPLLVLISMYIFVKIFGIIGLFIGPLYIILAKEILILD